MLCVHCSEVVEIWQILAQDAPLTTAILEHFLELLQKSLPYEEKTDPRDKTKVTRTATAVPLAVSVCAVHCASPSIWRSKREAWNISVGARRKGELACGHLNTVHAFIGQFKLCWVFAFWWWRTFHGEDIYMMKNVCSFPVFLLLLLFCWFVTVVFCLLLSFLFVVVLWGWRVWDFHLQEVEGFLDQCILVSAISLVVYFAGDICLGGTIRSNFVIMVYFTGFNLKGVFCRWRLPWWKYSRWKRHVSK